MPLPRGYRFLLCKRGHSLVVHGYVRPDTLRRECRICRRNRAREWARKRRLADRREAPQQ
jgi:hypothetical protein